MELAILTSGGDCAGMNPAIKYFVERCYQAGHRPWGVSNGLEGLIDGEIEPLGYGDVSGIIYQGGSILRCSRSKRFHDEAHRRTAAEQLASRGIEALIVVGGEGSFQGVESLHEVGSSIRCVGIPATIDNDVPGSRYSLGVDSALNVIRRSIDEIRDTAASFRRAFVIETMGRHSGYLAMVSAIVSGAEVCIIPELPYDLESMKVRLGKEFEARRNYAIAVVAEAVSGVGSEVVSWFKDELSIDSRLTVLGHTQRGGSPTVYDRLAAVEFVEQAITGLEAGEEGFAVVREDSGIARKRFSELPEKSVLSPRLLALAERLCR
ncbi:MAG: 6-phosphofructokinase [Verrucomicrobiales bacterium]